MYRSVSRESQLGQWGETTSGFFQKVAAQLVACLLVHKHRTWVALSCIFSSTQYRDVHFHHHNGHTGLSYQALQHSRPIRQGAHMKV